MVYKKYFRFLTKNDENDARVANLFVNFWSNGHGHRWGFPISSELSCLHQNRSLF